MKWLSTDTERKIRDLTEAERGLEVILERQDGAFTFDMDVKTEGKPQQQQQAESERKKPRNPGRADSNRSMEVDAAMGIAKGQYGALWEGLPNLEDSDDEEIQRHECNSGFHWR